MKTFTTLFVIACFAVCLPRTFAQETSSSPSVATSPVAAPAASSSAAAQPDMNEMMKQMTALSKLNENHKILADTAGTWNYTVKMWGPDPSAKPEESKGTATRKMIMDGRYLVGDYVGHMQMHGPDGKMRDMAFKGMGLEGYDNVKKKFVATWMDSMGTGIMMMEGTYDPTTKAMTNTGVEEPLPGMKTTIRAVTTFPDKDHMTLEWFENWGGQEKKAMEINYTRAGTAKAK
jgi:hypothetical protein